MENDKVRKDIWIKKYISGYMLLIAVKYKVSITNPKQYIGQVGDVS